MPQFKNPTKDIKAWLQEIQSATLEDILIREDLLEVPAFPQGCMGLRDLLEHSRSPSLTSLSDEFSSVNMEDDSITSSNKKRVSWNSEVEIREYNIVKGDHPSCSDGFPISLDWDYQETIRTKVDCFSGEDSILPRYPKRLSMRERRSRLYGDVTDTIMDFANTDSKLEMLLNDLEDSLNMFAESPSLPDCSLFSLEKSQQFWSNKYSTSRAPTSSRCSSRIITWQRVSSRCSNMTITWQRVSQ